MKPFFKHDCEKCILLGCTQNLPYNIQKLDHYVCFNTSKTTLIQRFGDKPEHYRALPLELLKLTENKDWSNTLHFFSLLLKRKKASDETIDVAKAEQK